MTNMRTLGASGLQTPPLILGGNVFGWTAKGDTAFDILDAFVAGGGTMIDTADVYSAWVDGHRGGESESLIGRWLAKRARRDDVLIATKVGMLPGEGGRKLEPAAGRRRGRCLAQAASDRLYRSLFRPSRRSGHAARRHTRGLRKARRRRQGPLYRRLQL